MTSFSTAAAAARENARASDGRFGEQDHADPGQLDLADDPSTISQDLIDLVDQSAHYVNDRVWRGQLDTDDLRQDVLLALWEQRVRSGATADGAAVGSGAAKRPSRWADERVMVFNVTRATATRKMTGNTSGPDYAGFRDYRQALADFAETHHRSANTTEQDQIAAQIRESFPPRRRPRIGFHRPDRLRTVPLEPVVRDGHIADRTDAALVHHDRADDPGFAAGTLGDRAHASAEEGTGAGRAAAHRMGFAALAESRGLPLPAEGVTSAGRATDLRRTIAAEGGAGALAQSLAEGRDTPATAGFLALFGQVSRDDGRRIGEMLDSVPGYTDDLVASAVSWSTKRPGGAR